MQIVDFSRSFVSWRNDTLVKPPPTVSQKPPFSLNNARVQVECRCEIMDTRSGEAQEFVLGANCKTEQVGVDSDIWTEPCGDFVPVFSKDRFLILKAYDRANKGVMLYPPERGPQPERQVGSVEETYVKAGYDLKYVDGEVLESTESIVQATLDGRPLSARIQVAGGGYEAIIDHPVKTMNANERDMVYQTDTGPVLLPDLSQSPENLIEGLGLAFAAFNGPSWVEFIVRVPTPVAEGIDVHHYSKPVRMDSKNSIIATT